MMKPLTEAGHQTDCPCCSRRLREVFPDEWLATKEPASFRDHLQAHREIVEDGNGQGFDVRLLLSHCASCDARLIEIDLRSIEAAGQGVPFVAVEGPVTWIVTRFETAHGARFAHRFGPFPDDTAAWLEPGGFGTCEAGAAWRLARLQVLSRWHCAAYPETRFRTQWLDDPGVFEAYKIRKTLEPGPGP